MKQQWLPGVALVLGASLFSNAVCFATDEGQVPCPTGVIRDGIQKTVVAPSKEYPNDRLSRPYAWERRGEIGLSGSQWVYTDPLGLPGWTDKRAYPNDVAFGREGERWIEMRYDVPLNLPGFQPSNGPVSQWGKPVVQISCDKPKPPKPPEDQWSGQPLAEEGSPLLLSCDKPKPPKPPEDELQPGAVNSDTGKLSCDKPKPPKPPEDQGWQET